MKQVAGVIGHPIAHSLSPVIMNAAIGAVGLDWVFLAFDVANGDGTAAIDAMRTLGLIGLSVTMPHKQAVIPALDRLTPDAQVLGAVNCVYRDGTSLVGDNTDGAGLIRSLDEHEGLSVSGRRCAVLGAGGAARSVIRALAAHGSAVVCVVNRSADRAESAALLAGDVGRVGTAADLPAMDLIINATSLGMAGVAPGELAVDPDLIGSHHVVVDLVYHPIETPLLIAATQRGARCISGVGMLVGQACLAFERWSGAAAPMADMVAAAEAAIAAGA